MLISLPKTLTVALTSSSPVDKVFARVPEVRSIDVKRKWDLLTARFEASFGTYSGTLRFSRRSSITALGSLEVAGPHRAELVLGLATAVRFLPTDALHAMAREAKDPAHRLATLQVLTDCASSFATPRVGALWVQTVLHALRDADRTVRSYAVVAALRIQLPETRQAAEQMAAIEQDPVIKRLAEEQLARVPRPQASAEAVAPAEPRLVLPFLPLVELEEILAKFPSDRWHLAMSGDDGGLAMAELRDEPGFDASVTIVSDTEWSVGVAAVRGRDRAQLAYKLHAKLHYYPIEHVKLLARFAGDPKFRSRALVCLAYAGSPLFGDFPHDLEIDEILLQALVDDSESVRKLAAAIWVFWSVAELVSPHA